MTRCMAAVLLCCITVCATASERKRILYLKSSEAEAYNQALQGIKNSLSRNAIDFDMAEYGQAGPGAKPDAIIALGSRSVEFLLKRETSVPIIFSMVVNPRFIAKNLTGVSLNVPPARQFGKLKELVRGANRIGVLYGPGTDGAMISSARRDAQLLGMELVTVEVLSENDVHGAARSLLTHVDALWMIPEPGIYNAVTTKDVLLQALRQKVPVIGISSVFVKAGALFALECDYEDVGVQTGAMTARVLKGETPGSIPVGTPRNTRTVLNLIVAEQIGLTIGTASIEEADYVYQ